MSIKIGMISFAHLHADSYATCLKRIGANIVGIYNEEKSSGYAIAKKYDSKFYEDYHELLKQELDAVLVCSANADHKEHVIAAAEAGCKYIMCEKPIATTVDDAVEMIEKCKANGSNLCISFPCRYIPAVIEAKRAIENNAIGKILAAKTTNHGRMPGGWFVQKEKSGGGAVMDHTPHVVDLLRWFMKSEPVEVYAEIDNKFYNMDIDDTGILSIQFDNGVFATLDTSWSRTKSYPTWGDVTMEIIGTDGVISVDSFAQDFDLYNDDNVSAQWVHWGDNMDLWLMKDYVKSVMEKKPFQITGEDGLAALKVAIAAYESARLKAPVKIER